MLASGCSAPRCSGGSDGQPDVAVVALPEVERPPVPRKNMVWIPAGPFIAGTPPDQLPRIADEEMPGVQLFLEGFYIDQYPHPNEPGAIQTTNVTHAEAQAKCEAQDKRLCTELELERACKGPDSTTYEYGSKYRAAPCGGSTNGHLVPTGTRVGCRSAFDVFDLHGGAFEWTASRWDRGEPTEFVAVRGGVGDPGEVTGRCANALPRRPDQRFPNVGFRCCTGEPNDAVVALEVHRSPEGFRLLARDPDLAATMERALPETLASQVPKSGAGAFRADRLWKWFPIGNEELLLASGCAHPGVHAICGVIIARFDGHTSRPLAFAPSGWWLPSVQPDDDRRVLWVFGGDGLGKYRRRVAFLWGSVGVSEPERGGRTVTKKRKKRGGSRSAQ
jgi:hypothetical protein